MRRECFIVMTALALGSSALGAQVRSEKCGTWRGAEARLTDIARYFTDAEEAEFREGMIETLPADAARQALSDERECSPIMRVAIRYLRDQRSWSETKRLGFVFNVFRIGPYYVVVLLENVPEGKQRAGGWATMLVFDAADLRLRGVRLV